MIIYVSAAVDTVFSDESRGFKNLGTFDSVFKMTVDDFYGKLFFFKTHRIILSRMCLVHAFICGCF